MRNWEYEYTFGALSSRHPKPSDTDLEDLWKAISKSSVPGKTQLPAGYTYFGQFVDHDLTLLRQNQLPTTTATDPDKLMQGRKPVLDLDSVYGGGLADSVIVYQKNTGKFQLGETSDINNTENKKNHDLYRDLLYKALIGDPRNDENLLVAQMQVLFMHFHNKVVDTIQSNTGINNPSILYQRAREEVIRAYQYIVLYDFAYQILPLEIYNSILTSNRGKLSKPDKSDPKVSVEFAGAVFRLHSLVRDRYFINNKKNSLTLTELFFYTGKSKSAFPLPANVIPDWEQFFFFKDHNGLSNRFPNFANPLSAKSVINVDSPTNKRLQQQLASQSNMSELNIKRGLSLNLKSGQAVFRHLRSKHRLLFQELGLKLPKSEILDALGSNHYFSVNTPLWLYTMIESVDENDGTCLGKLGGWILADTLRTAALSSDVQLGSWKPENSVLKTTLANKIRNNKNLTIEDLIVFTFH